MKKFFVLALSLCLILLAGCGSKVEKNLKLGSYETNVENPNPIMPSVVLKEDNKFDIIYKGAAYMNISGTYEINDDDEIVCTVGSEKEGAAEEGATYVFVTNEDYDLIFLGISDRLPTLENTEYVESYVGNNTEFYYADDYISDDDE